MSAKFFLATLTAAGTPQKLIASDSPTLPTISSLGVTAPAGSATERAGHLLLQANPGNTGTNIYIGGPGLNKSTLAGVGIVLAKTAAPVSLAQYGGNFALEDVWFDGDTTGDKLLVTVVG